MAAQKSIGIVAAPYVADVDLSAACAQYRFVTAASTANKVKAATGASNPTVLGVLQNSPSAAQEAAVIVLGYTKLTARNGACNVLFGSFIFSGSDGVAEAASAATGIPVCGKWDDTNITTGSAIGNAILFGLTGCSVSIT